MQVAFVSTAGQAVAADAAQFLDLSRVQILVIAESEVPVPAYTCSGVTSQPHTPVRIELR